MEKYNNVKSERETIKTVVKHWLENYADRYITLKSDSKYQVVTFKNTMTSDLMKHIDVCMALKDKQNSENK